MKNFAMADVGGDVAPRHLKAIKDTGNRLVAEVDSHDAVGVLDRYCGAPLGMHPMLAAHG